MYVVITGGVFVCRSEEWKKLPAKEREKMNIKIDDDGDFWSVCLDHVHHMSNDDVILQDGAT